MMYPLSFSGYASDSVTDCIVSVSNDGHSPQRSCCVHSVSDGVADHWPVAFDKSDRLSIVNP